MIYKHFSMWNDQLDQNYDDAALNRSSTRIQTVYVLAISCQNGGKGHYLEECRGNAGTK